MGVAVVGGPCTIPFVPSNDDARTHRRVRRVVVRVDTAGVFTMSVAAELCGLHPQTLRTYERHGLLAPARTDGGTRRYSEADVALIRRVAELSSRGMRLDAIALVLELEAENQALRAEVEHLRAAASDR